MKISDTNMLPLICTLSISLSFRCLKESYESILKVDPDNQSALAELILLEGLTGNRKKAFRRANKLISRLPDEGFYVRGMLHLYDRKIERGTKDLRTAAKRLKGTAAEEILEGIICLYHEDFIGAFLRFQESGQLDVDHPMFHLTRIMTMLTWNLTNTALVKLDDLVSKYPDSPIAYGLRGLVRLENKDFVGADEDLSTTLQFDQTLPWTEDIQLNRAKARVCKTDILGAIADFNHVISENPRNVEAYLLRALCRMTAPDIPGAINDFDMLIDELHIENDELRSNRAFLKAQSDVEIAREELEGILVRNPQCAVAHSFIGPLFMGTDPERGLNEIKKGYELEPNHPYVNQMMVVMYMSQNDPESAAIHLNRLKDMGAKDAFKVLDLFREVENGSSHDDKDRKSELVRKVIERDFKDVITANQTVKGSIKRKIQSTIKQEFGVEITDSALRTYLQRLGFTKERS